VEGAANERAAAQIARAIANSPLVKTAIAGSDPNWGRILSAAGNSGVRFEPATVDIEMQGVRVCRGGLAANFSEEALKDKLDARECSIRFSMAGKGRGRARFWTCDLTEEYIRINASYRT
jgi:glutamate N-acetyltransferase/amino-acid N-acetyltransferase